MLLTLWCLENKMSYELIRFEGSFASEEDSVLGSSEERLNKPTF